MLMINNKSISHLVFANVLFFVTLAVLSAQSELIMSLPADSIKKMTGKDTADILAVIRNDSIVKIIVPADETPTAEDVDGNSYSIVKIGSQFWMAENLRTTRFNDGTKILLVENVSKWSGISSPAYCWYNNEEMQYKHNFGALYNWYAVQTGKLCPAGWHIPDDEEWKQLENSIGLSRSLTDSVGFRGTNEAAKLKNVTYHFWWRTDVEKATNESGYSALPGGGRSGSLGTFHGMPEATGWWSSTEYYSSTAWMRGLYNSSNTIMRFPNYKKDGLSVRCIKDE
jgi:uncharacterized protein (TIGR02145 family)